jgi:hypothetical protein
MDAVTGSIILTSIDLTSLLARLFFFLPPSSLALDLSFFFLQDLFYFGGRRPQSYLLTDRSSGGLQGTATKPTRWNSSNESKGSSSRHKEAREEQIEQLANYRGRNREARTRRGESCR